MHAYTVNLPAVLAFYCCARKREGKRDCDFTLAKIYYLKRPKFNFFEIFIKQEANQVAVYIHVCPDSYDTFEGI